MIGLKNLSKVFQENEHEIEALSGINMKVKQGEIFGVIGYSGAGKSTLLRSINRLESPTKGEVTVGEYAMTRLSSRQLRKARQEIGMIFQHFHLLWSRTVRENVAFPLEIAGVPKEKRAEKVAELLEWVGLTERAAAYPNQLSGGQKQRVGIARALANQPKVLLCDEATSALDPETTDDILQLLQRIHHQLGLTIILITHEMHVIQKICERVAVMEAGKVVETGTVQDIFQRPQATVTQRFIQQVQG